MNDAVSAAANGFNLIGESVTTTAFDADKLILVDEYIVGVPEVPTEIDGATISPEADIVLSNIAGGPTKKLPVPSSIDAEKEPEFIFCPSTPPSIEDAGILVNPAPLPLNQLPLDAIA